IGQADDGYFLLQSNLSLFSERNRVGLKNRKYKISYYNKDLVYQWFMEVRPQERQYDVEKVLFVDNSVMIFYSSFDKQKEVLKYKTEVIDSKGKSTGYNSATFEIPVDPSFYIEQIEIGFSKDKSKIFYAMSCTNESDDTFGLCYGISDRQLNPIVSKSLKTSYDIKNYDTYQNVASNDGHFAHIGLVTEPSKENKKVLWEHYEMISSTKDESGHQSRSVTLENREVTECFLSFDEKNKKLVVTGFYFDKNSFLASGVFMNTLDLNNSESGQKVPIAPLSENIQIKLVTDREKDFGRGLSNYTIQKTIMRNDGGAVILAESSYINQYSYYDYFTQTFNNRTEYHFDNVIVISVNQDGSIDWNNIVRKNQESRDDMGVFSSYTPMIRQSEIVMFYNTNYHRNNEVLAEAVSNDGTQYQVTIARAMEHLTLLPRAGKQTGLNEIVVPALQKRKLKLLKVSL
ncbi:MAG: hypothetical protein HKN22_01320, partial [Bacteroidia bacterium]|nr:hypothetical protein [Bacteroidia bacterium]